MSLAQVEGRRQSPLLSNNPFRNRIPSNPPSPNSAPPLSKVSTNPFLDASELANRPPTMSGPPDTSPAKNGVNGNANELFENLSINDKSDSPRHAVPASQMNGNTRGGDNASPRGRMGAPGHRPTHSQDEKHRNQRAPRAPPGEVDIFADPSDSPRARERKPNRRNSESSIREKPKKPSEPDDEKRRRDRKTREKRYGKPKLANQRLDIIDKLDVTSIYGMGLFHHDGPFDACNPIRNRKDSKQAPLHAFPKDSRNMSIGGSGPNNSRLNLDQIHGTGQEAHIDYNEAAVVDEDAAYFRRANPARPAPFNTTARVEPLHGEETAGLGTSTFLEGAPASRIAIQRRESENEAAQAAQVYNGGAGLSRTKSLAQKIRGVRPSAPRPAGSPEPLPTPTSPLGAGKVENGANANPFFKDADKEGDRKGAQIVFAPAEPKTGRARAPSSPKRSGFGLERKMTQESIGGEEGKSSGGFLSRVKSLKGRSRARAEKRDAS